MNTITMSYLGSLHFREEIYAQNSGIHALKSDSKHYFGEDSIPKPSDPSKKSGFHSFALRKYFTHTLSISSGNAQFFRNIV